MPRVKPYDQINGGPEGYTFHCPGCNEGHKIYTTNPNVRPVWSFNGNTERPTFTPSLLITWRDPDGEIPNEVCHSFITDGRIQFLGDCTHALAGQTVDLPEVEG
ncbi:MAG: DUF6527 family protein [Caulobacteraceae bacterium]